MRMTSRRLLSWLLTFALMLHALFGFAVAGAQQSQNYRNPVQEFQRRFGRDWVVRVSADGQRIESILGKGTKTYKGRPAEAARQFLREVARFFGLKEDLSDLQVIDEKTTLGGGVAEFQQLYQSLPVENGRVQVSFDKEGRVIQAVSSYARAEGAQEQAVINREQATELSISLFLRSPSTSPKRGGQQRSAQPVPRSSLQLKETPQVTDTFFVKDGRLLRAYKIFINSAQPFGVREFVIDANTGELLLERNYEHTFKTDGTGQVFLPNPVNSKNDKTYTDTGTGAAAVPKDNPNPYFTMPLLALDDAVGGKFSLKGPFIVLQDVESPQNTPPTETSASFSYFRGDAGFDDVMLYYHIDRMQRYIQSLGFSNINNRKIAVDAHVLIFIGGSPDPDNSHYVNDANGTGTLGFGDGGVDDAEDAEIIAHEYGHSIQANQTKNKYDGVGFPDAMGEGFGDYWAASSYYNETKANGADVGCVGEWDATFYDPRPCLRRVDEKKTQDDFLPGNNVEHDNGEIWSATLWDIFNLLGKTDTDRLVLQSHFNIKATPTFKDGADAIITADLQLYSGSHINTLCTVFANRKIYGAGDCPSQVPEPTGTQNTLVVLAKFNDASLPAPTLGVTDVNDRIKAINNYLQEVTYQKASLGAATVKGWLDLGKDRAHYYDATTGNMLIEMVNDVIAKISASDQNFDFKPFDRMIILTNDDGSNNETRGLNEWATTGPWPYTLPAAFGTKRLSVSVHRADQTGPGNEGQLTHALGHHFGLIDLYAHEGAIFPRPYADGWGNMAKDPAGKFNNSHFFAWDKLRPFPASWLAKDAAHVRFIPRPPADPNAGFKFDETIPIFRQDANSNSTQLIQVGTTPGVSDRAQERVSYYIEARKKSGTFDSNIPSDGVLIYYLNEDIAQGFGPLRLVDSTPADNDLTNAAFKPAADGGPSSITSIDGTGLTVEVLPATGAEDYRVHITYDPPEQQVDVWLSPHDDNWNSPDIWVDSPACNQGVCGYDAAGNEADRGDKPAASHVGDASAPLVNRVYALVHNYGPGIAHDVQVDFWFSDPYQAMDGGTIDPDTGTNAAFSKETHRSKVIPTIDVGASVPVFVEWTPKPLPAGQTNPHSCIKVKIAHVFNDSNDFNQVTQENIDDFDISSHSPYPPVINNFKVVNPYKHPILVYLRADNVPVGWTTVIEPAKVFLPVGASVDGKITIQAPLDYPVCSSEFVKVSAWYPSGDTLIELGASTSQINLKTSTSLSINTTYESCDNSNGPPVVKAHAQTLKKCKEIKTKGCTNPARPFEHITVQYTGPDGKPVYHDVVTDANGCFEDFLVNPQPGLWNTQASYPGNDCASSTQTGTRNPIFVPLGGGDGDQGSGTEGRGRLWLSFHLGANFPLGSFNQTHNPGPSMTLNAEYPFRRDWSVIGYLGFHFFNGDEGNKNFHYTNLSVNLRRYFPVSNFRGYVEAGPGVYFPKTGSAKFGFNVGTGLSFPLLPKVKLEFGPDFHFVDPSGAKRVFVDARVGVAFRF